MSDQKSFTSSSTDSTSPEKPVSNPTSPNAAVAIQKSSKQSQTSWRAKLHLDFKKSDEPGKESWRDASLSDEQRWKEWNKAKDREQRNNGATGAFTYHYRAKGLGKWGYWLAL